MSLIQLEGDSCLGKGTEAALIFIGARRPSDSTIFLAKRKAVKQYGLNGSCYHELYSMNMNWSN